MKCFGILVALSLMCMVSARPQNGMFFYQQQQQPGYYQRQPIAHRMYVQYQPYKANRRSADVGGGLSAYAAGNTVAAGTYLRQTEVTDDFEAGVPQQDGTISVAEAYPEDTAFAQNDQVDQIDQVDQSVQADEPQYNDETPIAEDVAVPEIEVTVTKKKTAKEFTPVVPAVEDTSSADEVEQDEAVVPAKSPSKKKKVRVQLDEEEDDEEDDTAFIPYNTKSNRGGNPINTFFPVSFGKTSGGAIAVANSFSTGKGGTATSHATAYGSPSKKSKSKNRAAEE